MTGIRPTLTRLVAYSVVMLLVSAALAVVLSQFSTGSTTSYHAVFTDASGIKVGEKVRVAGVPVGTVTGVRVRDAREALIDFDVDAAQPVLESSRATIRYANLTGDRYLELLDGPGSIAPLGKGGTIDVERTAPALDLDKLVGGFKPLFRALDPDQVNKLSLALVQTLQGQGGTLQSIFDSTGSLTTTLSDRDQLIGEVVDNVNAVLGTIEGKGDQFSETVNQLQILISGLASDRDTIGRSISTLDTATGSVADLLVDARPDLSSALGQLDRAATEFDIGRPELESVLDKLPENYRKLVRTGVYGSFFQFYLCELSIKFTGPSGDPITAQLVRQYSGRCADS